MAKVRLTHKMRDDVMRKLAVKMLAPPLLETYTELQLKVTQLVEHDFEGFDFHAMMQFADFIAMSDTVCIRNIPDEYNIYYSPFRRMASLPDCKEIEMLDMSIPCHLEYDKRYTLDYEHNTELRTMFKWYIKLFKEAEETYERVHKALEAIQYADDAIGYLPALAPFFGKESSAVELDIELTELQGRLDTAAHKGTLG